MKNTNNRQKEQRGTKENSQYKRRHSKEKYEQIKNDRKQRTKR
jgi:hypothetical protein